MELCQIRNPERDFIQASPVEATKLKIAPKIIASPIPVMTSRKMTYAARVCTDFLPFGR